MGLCAHSDGSLSRIKCVEFHDGEPGFSRGVLLLLAVTELYYSTVRLQLFVTHRQG